MSRPKSERRRGNGRAIRPADLEHLDKGDLLELRLCDLPLALEESQVGTIVDRVRSQLAERGLRVRPHAWLADEWCSPDGIPGIGVPFYLAHPRLMRLERSMMLDCEGGSTREATMLVRHEFGHAMQHAFDLHRRRRWQRVFGIASRPYPDTYRPRPASKRFVHHLDGWYAQSHPVEDFAETFAVWLQPRSQWRRRYADWPALEKLEYVDELMAELAGLSPRRRSKARPYSIRSMRTTLREHYEAKQSRYHPGYSDAYDGDLRRLFSGEAGQGEPASTFLRRHRGDLRRAVSRGTGEYLFAIDQVMKEIIGRCRELGLRTQEENPPDPTEVAVLITVHAMNYLHTSRDVHIV